MGDHPISKRESEIKPTPVFRTRQGAVCVPGPGCARAAPIIPHLKIAGPPRLISNELSGTSIALTDAGFSSSPVAAFDPKLTSNPRQVWVGTVPLASAHDTGNPLARLVFRSEISRVGLCLSALKMNLCGLAAHCISLQTLSCVPVHSVRERT